MPLKPGTRLGPYEVTAPLGAGGMGEVYRASDTKLRREVAVKVLPVEFSRDTERLARFEREAHLLASLNHPNIASIYGLEESNGQPCLVLELVEGETLEERIAAGALSVEDALKAAQQIASALEAAHERGIIHRDLKPSNVKIDSEGAVKVLDFGLAKALQDDAEPRSSDPSLSPTVTTGGTRAGVILGTAPYMSPEQARGKPLDKRTDIWSFGCVLYECLTGKRLFRGETTTDILAAVLSVEPDWSRLPERTPTRVRELLQRCLERDTRNRQRDIGDARLELERMIAERAWTTAGGMEPQLQQLAAPKRRLLAGIALTGAGVVGGLLGAFLAGGLPRESATDTVTRVSAIVSENLEARYPAISPDGSTIAFTARDRNEFGGVTRLYTRRLDEYAERVVQGSEGVEKPTWSPDGRWLAFTAPVSPGSRKRRIVKVPADGSAPASAIMDAPENLDSFQWLPTGDLALLLGGSPRSVARYSMSGETRGQPVEISGAEGLTFLSLTDRLPGGRQVLGAAWIYGEDAGRFDAFMLDIDTGKASTLVRNGYHPQWSPTGHLLFTRGDTLLAAAFDPEEPGSVGDPVSLMDGLWRNVMWVGGWFGVSTSGTLVYSPGRATQGRRLVLVGRQGDLEPWSDDRLDFRFTPFVSPDGKLLAVTVTNQEDTLWEIRGSEVDRPRMRKLVDVTGQDCVAPIWSPDSRTIAYACGKNATEGSGSQRLYRRRFDGTDEPELLLESSSADALLMPVSFSRDGSALLVRRVDVDKSELLRLDLESQPDRTRKLTTLLGKEENPREASVSSDGQWIAYSSSRTGKSEVFVRRLRGDGILTPPIQVSDGGSKPRWVPGSGTTLELFYVKQQDIMGVAITADPAVRLSDPRRLFDYQKLRLEDFTLLPDGRMLAIQRAEGEDPGNEIRVVQHWSEALKRRVPIQ